MSDCTDRKFDIVETHSDRAFRDSFRRCFATVLVAIIIILALTGAARRPQDTVAGPVPLPRSAGSAGTVEPFASEARRIRHDDSSRGVRTGLWHATFHEQEVPQEIDQEAVPDDDATATDDDGPEFEPAHIAMDTMFPTDDSVEEQVLLSADDNQPGLPSRVPSLSAIEIEVSKAPGEVPEQLPTGPSNVTVIVLLVAAILSVGLITTR